ncbi:MAG: hypothetical protein OXJ37_17255 [Bryobacterales bacterium]|nr:hypothetical protein [Bryobacterales bacterium]
MLRKLFRELTKAYLEAKREENLQEKIAANEEAIADIKQVIHNAKGVRAKLSSWAPRFDAYTKSKEWQDAVTQIDAPGFTALVAEFDDIECDADALRVYEDAEWFDSAEELVDNIEGTIAALRDEIDQCAGGLQESDED